jgi:replication factor C subunit 2/4
MLNSKKDILWIEKYRPINIQNIVQQEDIKNIIQSNKNMSNLPHLLLYGPSGTGKTTSALAICKYLYYNDKYRSIYDKIINERVLKLNASDDRGIRVVREKIKIFASQAMNRYDNIPNFKIIILDEADVMTNDSQFALRRIIEQYSHITRFILICNYVTKIIPPLSSRCSKYRFTQIKLESVKTIILKILLEEKIKYDENDIDNIIKAIYSYSNGDLRKVITVLQRSVYLANINKISLNIQYVNEIINTIPSNLTNRLHSIMIKEQNSYVELSNHIKLILNNGFSSDDLIAIISKNILYDIDISDKLKSVIFIRIAEISNILSNGSNDYIQMMALCSYINSYINKII